MTVENGVGLVVAVALAVFLVCALLHRPVGNLLHATATSDSGAPSSSGSAT